MKKNDIVKELREKFSFLDNNERFLINPQDDEDQQEAYYELEQFLLTKLTQVSKEAEEKAKSQVLARLAVEVMEVEVQKNEDPLISGHLHGVRRSIYLIKQLKSASLNPSPEACRCVCHVRGTKWRLNGFVYDKTCNHCDPSPQKGETK